MRLGETYPRPVVDVKASREAALAAFSALRNAPVGLDYLGEEETGLAL